MDVRSRRLIPSLVAALLTLALAATPAAGSESTSRERAVAAAGSHPIAAELVVDHPGLTRRVEFRDGRWEVAFYDRDRERVGLVMVDARGAEVLEAWTGHQVAWPMARGYSGAFGRSFNAPYLFIPFVVVFLIGLIDWRRPARIVHLDLLVLVAFGLSHIFFNRGEVGLSVPLVYPALAYLAARMTWIGLRGARPSAAIRSVFPTNWLFLATLFLIGVRLGLNIFDSGVIDVGYTSVIGADRTLAGESIYGDPHPDVPQGDTYGPFVYYSYVPFVAAFPWGGEWSDLVAAHAAAIAFDLGTVALLVLIGLRLRPGPAGRRLAALLAFAWVANPYTAFTLVTNGNDGLVALLLVGALALGARPVARGVVVGLAVLTKFAPVVPVPILARHRGPGALAAPDAPGAPAAPAATGQRRRPWLAFSAALLATVTLVMLPTALGPGLGVFLDSTLAHQATRESPFSIWGQYEAVEWLRLVPLALAVGLAALTAFRPRNPDTVQVAALTAALLIGVQLATTHWFYTYIVWFYPAVLIALAVGRPSPPPPRSGNWTVVERPGS